MEVDEGDDRGEVMEVDMTEVLLEVPTAPTAEVK